MMLPILILAISLGVSLGVIEAHEDKKISLNQEESMPPFLYKLVTVEQWQNSQGQAWVALSKMDKDFVHLSKEDQVAHVAQKFFAGKDYVLLKLDSNQLEGRLIYECNPGGQTRYYHLYDGGIPLESVIEAYTIYSGVNNKGQ